MNPIAETLDAIKGAHQNPLAESIAKSYEVATGLVAYDLEPAAKLVFPVLTPLRNTLPRVTGKGGTATNWRSITAINPNQVASGVSEGRRGGIIDITKVDYTAAYKGIGLEDEVTFEAEYAAEGFDNVKALAVENLLKSLMIAEERIILGGNGGSVALGVTPTPTASLVDEGSSTLAAGTYKVICVALSFDGYKRASLNHGVKQRFERFNADGTSDFVNGGSAMKSAAASVTIAANTKKAIQATVTPVNGAVAYAWYVGEAGKETLQAITYANSVSIHQELATLRQAASEITADCSADPFVFDGLLYQAFKEGSGAQIINLDNGVFGKGTSLTSDGAGGINEIDQVLLNYWDHLKMSPTQMVMSARTRKAVSDRIVKNSNGTSITPLLQIVTDVSNQSEHVGTTQVTQYLNKITGQIIDMVIHPDMVDGMILFYALSVPYPLSGIGHICQIKTRREYYQIEWPIRTRRYEYGVYCDELLQHYFPPSLGILRNINVID